MEPFNFTHRRLADLAAADKLYYVKDTRLPGLILAVQPTGTKTFQVYRKINGQPKRVTLGRFPAVALDEARKLAQQTLAKLAAGVDPVKEKRAARARSVTLGTAADRYMTTRTLRPATLKNYKIALNKHLDDWKDKALLEITRDDIARRHITISATAPGQANLVMRFLGAVYRWAREEYLDEKDRPIVIDNPVAVISHRRQWNREPRRTDCIRPDELAAWWQATEEELPIWRDYLRLVVLTGLRREEAARLLWKDVDLSRRTLTVRQTKNGDDHTLPLSDSLHELLSGRRSADPAGIYVFPAPRVGGPLRDTGPITVRVEKRTGVYCTIHGLRRTFVTIAESLDIPAYALKKLLNHRKKADVTAGYLIIDVERLREPMQRITDYILKAANIKATAPVVKLPTRVQQPDNGPA